MQRYLSIRAFRFSILVLLLALGFFVVVPQPVASAQAPDIIDELLDADPDFTDDFQADREFWATPYDGETSRFLRSGRLHVVVDVPDTVAYSRGDTIVDDFYAEVDTIHVAGSTTNQLGLIFRRQDENNFYFFAIGNDGYYSLLRLENNSWTHLIEWEESSAIRTGSAARNRVAVLAEGASITLLVNDEVLGEVEDHSFDSGEIALTAGTYEQAGVEIAFDNFGLWRLGEPVVESPVAPPPLNQLLESDSQQDLQASLAEIRAESADYAENFESGSGGWDVFQTDNVLTEHRDASLVMLISAPQRLGASVFPREVTDFYMEVEVRHVDGPIDAEIGVVFRELDAGNYYFYAVTSDGYYSLWRRRSNEWQVLIDWSATDVLATGEGATNTLGVLAQGERLVLLANDDYLAATTDSAFNAGTIALVVGTFDTGDAEIAFEGVYIWDLEGQPLALPPIQRRDEGEPDGTDLTENDTVGETGSDIEDDSEIVAEVEFDAIERRAEILETPSTFFDDFRRNTGAWDLLDGDGYSFTYRQRALLGQIERTEWVAWTVLLRDGLSDYYFEIDATQISDTEDASYGIIFRVEDSDNFYQLVISIYGNYSLWQSVDGEWELLLEWTNASAIRTGLGETNRLGVLAEDTNIGLFVNGELIETLHDIEFLRGTVGLAVETFSEPGLEVLFDNAELWDIARQ